MKRKKSPLKPQAFDFFSKAGKRGAKKRQQVLSPEQRTEIARKAIKARWDKVRAERGQA